MQRMRFDRSPGLLRQNFLAVILFAGSALLSLPALSAPQAVPKKVAKVKKAAPSRASLATFEVWDGKAAVAGARVVVKKETVGKKGKKVFTTVPAGRNPLQRQLRPGSYTVEAVVPPKLKGNFQATTPMAFTVDAGKASTVRVVLQPTAVTVRVQMPAAAAAPPVPAPALAAAPAAPPSPQPPVQAPPASPGAVLLPPTADRPYPVEQGKALLFVRTAPAPLPEGVTCSLDKKDLPCPTLFSPVGISVSLGKHSIVLQREKFEVTRDIETPEPGKVYQVALALPTAVRLQSPTRHLAVKLQLNPGDPQAEVPRVVPLPTTLHFPDGAERFHAEFVAPGYYPAEVSQGLQPLVMNRVYVRLPEDPQQQSAICSSCGQGVGFLRGVVDIGTGYPDVMFARFKMGVFDFRGYFRLDAGVEVRSSYWNTIGGGVLQAELLNTGARSYEPKQVTFALGARTFIGGGGGNTDGISRSDFTLEAGLVPTLKIIDKIFLSMEAYYQLNREDIVKRDQGVVMDSTGGGVIGNSFVLGAAGEVNINSWLNFYLRAAYRFGLDRAGHTSRFSPVLFGKDDQHLVVGAGVTVKIPQFKLSGR